MVGKIRLTNQNILYVFSLLYIMIPNLCRSQDFVLIQFRFSNYFILSTLQVDKNVIRRFFFLFLVPVNLLSWFHSKR